MPPQLCFLHLCCCCCCSCVAVCFFCAPLFEYSNNFQIIWEFHIIVRSFGSRITAKKKHNNGGSMATRFLPFASHRWQRCLMADGSASSSAGWWLLLLLLVTSWWVLMAWGSPAARLLAGLVEFLGAALAAAWCCGVWPWQRPCRVCPVLELPARGRRHWHCSRRGAALCRWATARRGAEG